MAYFAVISIYYELRLFGVQLFAMIASPSSGRLSAGLFALPLTGPLDALIFSDY